MTDDELDALLRQTTPRPSLPTSFQREVWQELASHAPSPWLIAITHVCAWFARPSIAFATVTLLTVGGGWLGLRAAPAGARTTYVQTISPFLAAAEPDHQHHDP